MKDVHSEDLEALLDFMYRGVVHIQKSALSTLLKTAEGLQIRGLGLIGQDASMQGDQNSLSGSGVERISLTALEPSVFLSPDRKRSYDINTNASSDHDASTSLANFSEADLDDHSMNTSHSGGSPHKKAMHRMIDHPPASVPDLPKINEDTVIIAFPFLIILGKKGLLIYSISVLHELIDSSYSIVQTRRILYLLFISYFTENPLLHLNNKNKYLKLCYH